MLKRALFGLLAILSVLIISGCSGTIPIGSRGLDVIDFRDLSKTCQNIVKIHNFSLVRACSDFPFTLDGKKLIIVDMTFGDANDCPSGCFYSGYTGVIEDGKEYSLCYALYDVWESPEQYYKIPAIYPDIFFLAEKLGESTPINCNYFIAKTFYGNETTCMQIPSEKYRQSCLQRLKWKKESDFKEATRDATDLKTCNDAPSSSARERCITHVAHNLQDLAICDKITDAEERNEHCLDGMDMYLKPRTKELNLAVCKKMDPSYIKRGGSWMGLPVVYSCITSMAIDFEDKSICEELPTTSLKKRCAGEFENFEKYK